MAGWNLPKEGKDDRWMDDGKEMPGRIIARALLVDCTNKGRGPSFCFARDRPGVDETKGADRYIFWYINGCSPR